MTLVINGWHALWIALVFCLVSVAIGYVCGVMDQRDRNDSEGNDQL